MEQAIRMANEFLRRGDQLLFDRVKIAFDRAAGRRGMTAAAELRTERRCVDSVVGTHRDLEHAAFFFAHGDAHLHAFDPARDVRQPFHLIVARSQRLAHGEGGVDDRDLSAGVKLHGLVDHALHLDLGAGFDHKVDVVDRLPVAERHHRSRDMVRLRRGVGVYKAAGVGRDAGVDAAGDVFVELHIQQLQQLPDDLGGCRRGAIHIAVLRFNRVGAVVVDTQIDMIDALHHAVAQQLPRRNIDADNISGNKILFLIMLCQIGEFGRQLAVDGNVRPLTELAQRQRQRVAAAEAVAVGIGVGQDLEIVMLFEQRSDFVKRYLPHPRPPLHLLEYPSCSGYGISPRCIRSNPWG